MFTCECLGEVSYIMVLVRRYRLNSGRKGGMARGKDGERMFGGLISRDL